MFGKPEDVEGECNSHLYLGDDYGDNTTTIRCQLSKGHTGPHVEWFYKGEGKVTISWEKDEREEMEREEAYDKATRELEATPSGWWHSLDWNACRCCAHWSGNRDEHVSELNGQCFFSLKQTAPYDTCELWSSCDPETAEKFRELDRKFGKDYHK